MHIYRNHSEHALMSEHLRTWFVLLNPGQFCGLPYCSSLNPCRKSSCSLCPWILSSASEQENIIRSEQLECRNKLQWWRRRKTQSNFCDYFWPKVWTELFMVVGRTLVPHERCTFLAFQRTHEGSVLTLWCGRREQIVSGFGKKKKHCPDEVYHRAVLGHFWHTFTELCSVNRYVRDQVQMRL